MLSDNVIKTLVEKGKLGINNVDLEFQLTPVGVDLRLGSSYKRVATGEVFSSRTQVTLQPESFYHMHTVESLDLPDDIYGRTEPIMENSLRGVDVTTGVVDPGYTGRLILGVKNQSERTISLSPQERIVQIGFEKLSSPAERTHRGETYYDKNM